MGDDFDNEGHLSGSVLETAGVSPDAVVYLCGPNRFMADMKDALSALGVAHDRIFVELFTGSESMMPGVVDEKATRRPHPPEHDADAGALVSFARSGIAAHWNASAYGSLSGTRRSVRRAGSLVVPYWCVPQLRERPGVRRCRVRSGTTGRPSGRQPARLLLATDSRRGDRLVSLRRPDECTSLGRL